MKKAKRRKAKKAKKKKKPENKGVRTIIGLGNPGSHYRATRHNAGFILLDEVLRRKKLRLKAGKGDYMVAISDDEDTAYVKPLTFMNNSGAAVGDFLKRYHAKAEDMLVLHDELDLPLGSFKFKAGGSAGTHNGLRSIIYTLGSEDFPRLKIGIDIEGRREGWTPVDFVLGKFPPSEKEALDAVIPRAADAVDCYINEGLEPAMTRYHQRTLQQA